MAFRREIVSARFGFDMVLTVSVLLTASVAVAQGGRGGPPRPPYTPAAGARDLRAVLFNWTSYTGMLRGLGSTS